MSLRGPRSLTLKRRATDATGFAALYRRYHLPPLLQGNPHVIPSMHGQ